MNTDALGQSSTESSCTTSPTISSGNCSFSQGEGSDVDADNAAAFGSSSATGTSSFAAAASTASGSGAVALSGGDASGIQSFAASDGEAAGHHSTATSGSEANGEYSIAFGLRCDADGDNAVVAGKDSYSNGTNAVAIGFGVEASSTYSNNHVIGAGVNPSTRLTNGISNSLMIGYNSTVPTLFVEGSSGTGTWGRVGIGTTDPEGILHIRDESGDDTELVIDQNGTAEANLRFNSASTTEVARIGINANGGSSSNHLFYENLTNNLDQIFRVTVSNTLTEAMRIDGTTGWVGIGAPVPGAPLSVRDQIDGTNGREELARFSVADAALDWLQIRNGSTTNGEFLPEIFGEAVNHNADALRLIASTDDDTGTQPVMSFVSRVKNDPPDNVTTRPIFQWRNNGATRMHMLADGSLGIGTTSPSEILHINGIGRSDQAEWTTTSDVRLKENIQPIEGARQLINQFNPVTFSWVSAFADAHPSSPDANWGFIAQEVEQVMPEMVVTVPEENVSDSVSPWILTDLKLLNTSALQPILVKAFQELDGQVVGQQQVIEELQGTVDSLLAIVASCCQNVEPSFRYEDGSSIEIQEKNASFLLFQNDPNPFQYSTNISYLVPSEIQRAEILVTDHNGRVLKRIQISNRAIEGQITIYSSDLSSGIYSYSLIGDGRVLQSKKMVCVK